MGLTQSTRGHREGNFGEAIPARVLFRRVQRSWTVGSPGVGPTRDCSVPIPESLRDLVVESIGCRGDRFRLVGGFCRFSLKVFAT